MACCGLIVVWVAVWLAGHGLAIAGKRVPGSGSFAEFAGNYLRLFSGVTVYRAVPGSIPPTSSGRDDWTGLDIVWWLVAVFIGWGLWRLFHQQERVELDGCLLCTWALMLAAFYVVAGPRALTYHCERYGLCLIAPGVLVCGRSLFYWLTGVQARRMILVGSLLFGWSTLLGFQKMYFEFFHQTGGRSHAWRAAAVDPNVVAFQAITQQRDFEGPTWIVATDYWHEMPLAYFAFWDDGLRIENWQFVSESPELWKAAKAGRAWFVHWPDATEIPESPAKRRNSVRRNVHLRLRGPASAATDGNSPIAPTA